MSNPAGWAAPKIDWATSDGIGTADLTKIGTNANATETGNRTVDQTQNPTNDTASLQDYVDESAHQLHAIIGKTKWYDAPTKTIESLSLLDVLVVSGSVTEDKEDAVDFYSGGVLTQCINIIVPANKRLTVSRAQYRIAGAYRLAVGLSDSISFQPVSGEPGDPSFNVGQILTNFTQPGTAEILARKRATFVPPGPAEGENYLVIKILSGAFALGDVIKDESLITGNIESGRTTDDNATYVYWQSADKDGDESPTSDNTIYNNLTASPVEVKLNISISNPDPYDMDNIPMTTKRGDGWRLALWVNSDATTTTTTTTAGA